jgi:hypothetical protein
MSARQLAGFARRAVQIKTANYTVTKADVASVIVATGSNSWTLALPAAASVGAGFCLTLRNAGKGRITIDPNGSETVNGVTTLGCYQQDTVELICDGTNWLAMFQSPFSIVAAETTTGALATIDLTLPSEFKKFTLELDGLEPSVIATMGMRLSIDGGSSFYSGSGAYAWNGSYDSSATASATTYKSASSTFGTTGFEITPGTQAAVSGASFSSLIEILTRATSRYSSVRWNTSSAGNSFRATGYLGISTSDINAVRILYNSGANIAVGARYTLIGQRG